MSSTGPPLPPAPSDAPRFTGRAAYVLAQLYYYLVAIVAIGFVIGGAIAALIAVRELVLPDPGHQTRESVRHLLQGLAFVLPGGAAAWWHLGQARRREGVVAPFAFWGRSLYLHGVAFVAYAIALGGMVARLFALIDVALVPECPAAAFEGVTLDFCTDRGDALRSALNGSIIVLVAGAVWWWHLREGRRTMTP